MSSLDEKERAGAPPGTCDAHFDSDSSSSSAGQGRTSTDVRQRDHETLTAEEEVEQLLSEKSRAATGFFGRLFQRADAPTDDVRNLKRVRRRGKKRRRRERQGEEDRLIDNVEEGGPTSDVTSSASSSEVDMGSKSMGGKRKSRTSKCSCCGKYAAVLLVLNAVVALIIGGYFAYRRPTHRIAESPASTYTAPTLSNGTHDFAPTTILISLDGFRADFVHRGITPALSQLILQGISPKYMMPSFPSLTFPNHFTLVTGLHPESHGIVANTFRDPSLEKSFYYTDPARSMQEEWWNAEPLWEAAELQGVRSAIHMWPGSEAPIGKLPPTYVDKFNGKELLDKKVDRILGLLDIPGPNDSNASEETPRPQLIAAYVPNVDADGHQYGPNSTYIRSTIAEVDGMVHKLLSGLDSRNLTEVVNIIIVSDHGMATTSNSRMVQLEDLVDRALIEYTDGWPLYGLRPFNTSDEYLYELYNGLVQKSQLEQYQDAFDVYLRDKNMPERYHFAHNDRIAPVWIVPRAGWAIVSKDEFDVQAATANNEVYHPRGLHGYDNEHPLMRAIFIARGPAFSNSAGNLVAPFQNTEVYGIVCDSLGIRTRPNNGTIRLPFEAIGQHSEADVVEFPHDPDDHKDNAQILPPDLPGLELLPPAETNGSGGSGSVEAPAHMASESHIAEPAPEIPVPRPEIEKPKKDSSSWLDWVNEKVDQVKHWATDVFGTHKTVEEDA
ncbi:unnamed protein product [Zymoseptoria tritici ST99CH_1A5]|uniref:Uncharacterized protein n=2 Tax=Zymoseptoria tritici TaxID=1047171 RepID=A0A2H1FMT7_ZYMTR|nr:unnamed protein product [Zymoseptoria tritici ST99CH_1E4]SMY19994.1 unnamed protein product [Zymoseptoria tritici ST99CH_1A5]